MGKSPGKWIKTVLFGKKNSKSSLSKNATSDKKVAAKAPVDDVVSESRRFTDRGADNMEHEKGTSGTLCDTNALSPVNQGVESPISFVAVSISDAEMRRQAQAATKAQAAFRGYLARRAFRALKGIIRLQALIRGHLVRRQAVATLHSMHAIVRLQALARGRRVRLSNTMPELCQKYNLDAKREDVGANTFLGSEKLARNAFARKLLLSLPTAMPLSLQYDTTEPNSASNWLERWSLSQFWIPPPQPKKILNVKPKKKQIGSQIIENEAGKSKRSVRKASNAANRDSGVLASFEAEKPKNNPRKVASLQIEQEQPQNELERVKCSLRKVSASEKSEMETEKPQQHLSLKKESNSAVFDEIAKKPAVSDVISDKQASLEISSETATINESEDVPKDDASLVEPHFLVNDEKIESTPFVQEESGKENQKIWKRRSFPSKQEYDENISRNTRSMPSYMAATESAKAKLRAQESTKLSDDGAEYGGSARRHSLPASMNGKLSSLSPRIQKPLHANGKGGNKSNRSFTSSRDDKVGWRR